MARLVVLRFENNDDAQQYVEDRRRRAANGQHGLGEVVYMVAQPTIFCECASGESGKSRAIRKRGFSRGKKYGWWVCSICHKPTKLWASVVGAVIGGNNLLVKSEDAKVGE